MGTKRIPSPEVIEHVRALHAAGAHLYLWSSGGAAYARASAEELGIAALFRAFLPKPNVLVDDQDIASWRRLKCVHPRGCGSLTIADYRAKLTPRAE